MPDTRVFPTLFPLSQAALAALATVGGNIQINTAITLTTKVTFTVPVRLTFGPGGSILADGITTAIEFSGVNGVFVDSPQATRTNSLSLAGLLSFVNCDNVVLLNPVLYNGAMGATFQACRDVLVLGGEISLMTHSGIRANKHATHGVCKNVFVDSVTFKDIGSAKVAGHGAVMFGADGSSSAHENIHIVNTVQKNITHIAIGCDGAFLGLNIVGNQVVKDFLSGEGVAVGGSAGAYAEKVVISLNTIEQPVGAGGAPSILLYNSVKGATVTQNRVSGAGTSIFVHQAAASGHSLQDCYIGDNDMANSDQGVLLYNNSGVDSSPASKNVIIGTNRLTGVTTPIERSTIRANDKVAFTVLPQVVESKMVYQYAAGFGEQFNPPEKFVSAAASYDTANTTTYGLLAYWNNGTSGSVTHDTIIGVTGNSSIPTQKLGGMVIRHSTGFANVVKTILMAGNGGNNSLEVFEVAVNSTQKRIARFLAAVWDEYVQLGTLRLWQLSGQIYTKDASDPASSTDGFKLARMTSVPANAGAAGTAGDFAYDASFLYICTATNTWKRASIATW